MLTYWPVRRLCMGLQRAARTDPTSSTNQCQSRRLGLGREIDPRSGEEKWGKTLSHIGAITLPVTGSDLLRVAGRLIHMHCRGRIPDVGQVAVLGGMG